MLGARMRAPSRRTALETKFGGIPDSWRIHRYHPRRAQLNGKASATGSCRLFRLRNNHGPRSAAMKAGVAVVGATGIAGQQVLTALDADPKIGRRPRAPVFRQGIP